MTKRLSFIALFLIAFSSLINAQHRGTGIGVIIGEPTGISLKTWVSRTTALDLALAWSFADPQAFHLHMDYLYHNFHLIDVPRGRLPFYFGVGGRIKFTDEQRAGVRFPLGLAYLFEDTPIDIFFEITPLLDLAPKTDFTLNAAIGFRFYF